MPQLIIIGRPTPTITLTDSFSTTTNATSYSPTLSLGTAEDPRLIVVGVSSFNAGPPPATTLSSLTIAGIAATRIAGTMTSMWYATVPAASGTSGTVAAVFNGNASCCVMEVYASLYLSSHTPFASASGSGTSISLNINLPDLGVAVGIAGSTGAQSWSGLTENDERSADGQFISGASGTSTSAETPRSISVSSGPGGVGISASWG